MTKVTKTIQVDITYFEGIQDEQNGIFEGGPADPVLDDLFLDISEDEIFDFEQDTFVKNGQLKVQIAGSPATFAELGKYFLALAQYETKDPHYHVHFDDIPNFDGTMLSNVIIHVIKKDR